MVRVSKERVSSAVACSIVSPPPASLPPDAADQHTGGRDQKPMSPRTIFLSFTQYLPGEQSQSPPLSGSHSLHSKVGSSPSLAVLMQKGEPASLAHMLGRVPLVPALSWHETEDASEY